MSGIELRQHGRTGPAVTALDFGATRLGCSRKSALLFLAMNDV